VARIVKEEEYALRRNEILDVATRLVYSRGYEQMSIQEIIDALHISKGAFYHYFPSKPALLDAFIERSSREVLNILPAIVEDPALPALEKLNLFFKSISNWKNERKGMLLSVMRVLYSDDNAIVRGKQQAVGLRLLTPWVDQIIAQGIREGVLTISCPHPVGEVVLSLLITLGDTLSRLLLSCCGEPAMLQKIEASTAVYMYAIEQVLGIPGGTLHLIDQASIKEWFEMAVQSQAAA
jgi:AcrR family transcriptional regulator